MRLTFSSKLGKGMRLHHSIKITWWNAIFIGMFYLCYYSLYFTAILIYYMVKYMFIFYRFMFKQLWRFCKWLYAKAKQGVLYIADKIKKSREK